MTLTITLTGNGAQQTATCGEHNITKTKGSSIRPLARKLQEVGHDPETLVVIKRGETVCFKPAPLKAWADWMLYENDTKGGFRLQRWDYDAAAKLAESRRAA